MELVLVIIVLSLSIYCGLANAKNILEVQGSNSIKLIVKDDIEKVPTSLKNTVVKEDTTAYLPQGYNSIIQNNKDHGIIAASSR